MVESDAVVQEPAPTSNGIDLHTHTTASDGLLAPAELISLADERGLFVLGITDHDTIDGLDEAVRASDELDLTVIPGVELSTNIGSYEVHVLGYFVDTRDEVFVQKLADLAQMRIRRIVRVVEKLNAAGYPIELAPILEQAASGTIGRPHVARALIDLGAVANVSDAFDRFLTPGTPGWVPRERFTPEDAVALILANGAIPVLAHPYTTGDVESTLARLVPAGLVGLEVFYGEYAPDQHRDLLAIARRWNLLSTGGSDYHGPNFKEGRELGSVPIPEWAFRDLSDRHRWVDRS